MLLCYLSQGKMLDRKGGLKMSNREPITDFYGRILGYVEHKPNGDKVLTAFSGVILGYYIKSTNQT